MQRNSPGQGVPLYGQDGSEGETLLIGASRPLYKDRDWKTRVKLRTGFWVRSESMTCADRLPRATTEFPSIKITRSVNCQRSVLTEADVLACVQTEPYHGAPAAVQWIPFSWDLGFHQELPHSPGELGPDCAGYGARSGEALPRFMRPPVLQFACLCVPSRDYPIASSWMSWIWTLLSFALILKTPPLFRTPLFFSPVVRSLHLTRWTGNLDETFSKPSPFTQP